MALNAGHWPLYGSHKRELQRMTRHLTTANALISQFSKRARGGMPVMLDVCAATLLSEGAKLIYQPAGWITAGLAVLAINWRIHSDQ